MAYSDVVQTISEVAAALAGFTAVLVAFRRGEHWSKSEIVGLVHFLQLSIGVVLLALLPLLLGSLEPIASWSWRISNAILGAYHVVVVVWLLMRRQHAPALRGGGSLPGSCGDEPGQRSADATAPDRAPR